MSLIRSFLFVPGDSERKQQKALVSAADALILDLEDSVDASQLAAARSRVRELLRSRADRSRPQLWVRVNAPSSGLLLDDLAGVVGTAAEIGSPDAGAPRQGLPREGTPRGGSPEAGSAYRGLPDGIVLPKVSSPAEIVLVAEHLTSLEARVGAATGSVRLLVIATETPLGLLSLPQYPTILGAHPAAAQRVAGLTWGAEDLSAALGARGKFDASGALTFTFQMARTSCLLAAAALGVQPVDGVYVDFRNADGLKRDLESARRDGFSGKLAIHPDQVAVINEAFRPTEAEKERARRIVAAFDASPGAGVVSLDGQMVDRPHLIQARRILELADEKEDVP